MTNNAVMRYDPRPDDREVISPSNNSRGGTSPYCYHHDGPVEEEKEEAPETDAEQWLTRQPTTSSDSGPASDDSNNNQENINTKPETIKHTAVQEDKENHSIPKKPVRVVKKSDERSDAEQWLTRGGGGGGKELLHHWKKQQDDRYTPAIETRSSVSSPGKASLREKLQHRLHKRHELNQKKKQQLEYEQPERRMDHDDSMDDILGTWTDLTEPTSPISDSGLSTPVDPHPRRPTPSMSADESSHSSYYRLSRTVRYGRRGEVPRHPVGHSNVIRLHVYDLLANDTIMQLPFGCDFPIGQCFQTMNDGLHALGTGAYHCGIEVNGIEYAYGANDIAGSTGVFTCVPKHSPGYEYRATIDFGPRTVRRTSWVNVQTDLVNVQTGEGKKVSDVYEAVDNYMDGRDILKQMAADYRGMDYDLLEKNCCTFARDACLRLGVEAHEIPTWFMNLPNTGADARDAAQKTIAVFAEPGRRIQVAAAEDEVLEEESGGFEVIAKQSARTSSNAIIDHFTVVDTLDGRDQSPGKAHGVRRTLSWTY